MILPKYVFGTRARPVGSAVTVRVAGVDPPKGFTFSHPLLSVVTEKGSDPDELSIFRFWGRGMLPPVWKLKDNAVGSEVNCGVATTLSVTGMEMAIRPGG